MTSNALCFFGYLGRGDPVGMTDGRYTLNNDREKSESIRRSRRWSSERPLSGWHGARYRRLGAPNKLKKHRHAIEPLGVRSVCSNTIWSEVESFGPQDDCTACTGEACPASFTHRGIL